MSIITGECIHALTADVLRATWPRHTAKHAARAANGSVGTAKAWVQRRFRPDADTLLRMARESVELRAELVRLLGEWNDIDTLARSAVASETGFADRQAGGRGATGSAADALRVTS